MSDQQREELATDGMMSVEEFMKFAGLGKTEAYEVFNRGDVRSTKVGRRRLVYRRSAIRWLASLAVPAGA